MVNTDRHGEEGKWRPSSLPRLPETERSFEEGCLSDTVNVGHPEAAENVQIYLDDRLEFRVQPDSSIRSVSGIYRVHRTGQGVILVCEDTVRTCQCACHLPEVN